MHSVIQRAIEYAYNNKMRLLVEVEPDNKRIFVYCDECNVSDFAVILKPLKRINWITTNQFIKYEYHPKCVTLEIGKGKFQLRFWKKYNIDLIETLEKDIYFIDRDGVFTVDEKKVLIEVISDIDFKNNSLDFISELFYSDNRLKACGLQELAFNLYNDFGIIFFK